MLPASISKHFLLACAKHLAAGDEAVHDGHKSQQNCYEN